MPATTDPFVPERDRSSAMNCSASLRCADKLKNENPALLERNGAHGTSLRQFLRTLDPNFAWGAAPLLAHLTTIPNPYPLSSA
jgi:hypothetical protein